MFNCGSGDDKNDGKLNKVTKDIIMMYHLDKLPVDDESK